MWRDVAWRVHVYARAWLLHCCVYLVLLFDKTARANYHLLRVVASRTFQTCRASRSRLLSPTLLRRARKVGVPRLRKRGRCRLYKISSHLNRHPSAPQLRGCPRLLTSTFASTRPAALLCRVACSASRRLRVDWQKSFAITQVTDKASDAWPQFEGQTEMKLWQIQMDHQARPSILFDLRGRPPLRPFHRPLVLPPRAHKPLHIMSFELRHRSVR